VVSLRSAFRENEKGDWQDLEPGEEITLVWRQIFFFGQKRGSGKRGTAQGRKEKAYSQRQATACGKNQIGGKRVSRGGNR